MNPLSNFTFSSLPLSLLLIILLTTVTTLPIGEKTLTNRTAAIQDHFPPKLKLSLGALLDYPEDLSDDYAADTLKHCYTAYSELNIFNRSLPFSAVVQWYYLNRFPRKAITTEGIYRLVESTQSIISQCSAKGGRKGLKYGLTFLSDQPFPYLEALLLEKDGRERRRGAKSLRRADARSSPRCELPPIDSPLPLTFDWREHQAVTPVRSQQFCGSCWLFASMAALESALLLHSSSFSGMDPRSLDLAEQQLVVCAKGCKGGEVGDAYEYILQHGITFEEHLRYDPHPYSGYFDAEDEDEDEDEDDFSPFSSSRSSLSLLSSGTCSEELHRELLLEEEEEEDYDDDYSSLEDPSSSPSLPKIIYPLEGYCWLKDNTDLEMKLALLSHGPLYVSMNAEDSGIASAEFEGGAVNASHCNSDPLNHSVLLVGYTEDTWILKNSWGRDWNGDGYFEVVQGRQMCGINREMAWPLLKKNVF